MSVPLTDFAPAILGFIAGLVGLGTALFASRQMRGADHTETRATEPEAPRDRNVQTFMDYGNLTEAQSTRLNRVVEKILGYSSQQRQDTASEADKEGGGGSLVSPSLSFAVPKEYERFVQEMKDHARSQAEDRESFKRALGALEELVQRALGDVETAKIRPLPHREGDKTELAPRPPRR